MRIFVSYSRKDIDIAEHLYDYFIESDYYLFTDIRNIKVGDVWSKTIETNISTCDFFVVIITYSSLKSSQVEKEVIQAKNERKPIIPCIYKYIKPNEIKWDLDNFQGIKFEEKYDLARNFYRKIEEDKQNTITTPIHNNQFNVSFIRTYENQSYGFSMQFPSDWIIDENSNI